MTSPAAAPARPSLKNGGRRPKIGLTMGDAAGIGPEIVVKALTHEAVYTACQPIVIGSAAILADACRRFSVSDTLVLNSIETPNQAVGRPGTLDVLEVSSLAPHDISIGAIDASAGAAAAAAIETGTRLALHGELDAITTAPINKAALHRAGVFYPGHTEMLAALTDTPHVVMMLCPPEVLNAGPVMGESAADGVGFGVAFVTNHVALADVPKRLSVERIVAVIRTTRETLVRCGVPDPRIVVAGLNPHAGESGLFGNEEACVIRPAVSAAQAAFSGVEGPLPADALFVKARRGAWHAVVVMYHDQGNIPIKLLGFGALVNITLGLPILRTSVDHGTAFDIAGKGVADETSLVGALLCAARLATNTPVKP